MAVVEVCVLGPVELIDGASTVRLPRAERTVLAALASRLGERVAVDVLVEALWPNKAPPSARKTLQVYVTRLRHAVGASAIVERGGGYLLDPDVVAVDATRVAAMVGTAREASHNGDAETAVGLFVEATAVFRGEPYEGVPEGALPAGEIVRLHELRATLVEETVEADLACGRGHQRVGELEAFVQANPYRERAWGLLMRALYEAGRPADALAAYGRARVVLAAELGIEPGPALREIEQAILTHDPRLRDDVTSPRAHTRADSNLPAPVSPLIGRDLELATLDPLVVPERLVTLTGVGGIGKTRLAIEIATRTVGRHPYGPFFVDLAPICNAELVPTALASVLSVDVEPGSDAIEAVHASLGDSPVVVVMDNCEHLLPSIAALVAELLAACAGARVLATSREPLGVAGERVCPIDPLPLPPATSPIDAIENSAAGALFLARLPTNPATGPLSADELAAVGTICRQLEGIPLALELAAARGRTLPLPNLAERLRMSIDELAPSRHGVPARHGTMRAALDWGYELLTPPAQTALRALSVFAGGCDLDAFSAVCYDEEHRSAIEVLDELVRTSFAAVEFANQRTRYRLLEPVRQYARQLLGDEEIAVRHRHHLDHYATLAGRLARDVDQSGSDADVDPLRRELGNFRVALDWAVSTPDGTEAGLWLVARLHELWTNDGMHDDGLSRTLKLLDASGGSASARSLAAYSAGFVAYESGHGEQSDRLFERALAEALSGGDLLGEVRARRVLAECAVSRGDVAAANRHLQAAIPIAKGHGNDTLHARCVAALSQLLSTTGHLDEAEQHIQSLFDAAVVPSVDVWAHGELARIMFERGDYSQARSCYTRILESFEPSVNGIVHAHLGLAATECASGDIDKAASHIGRVERMLPETATGWDPYIVIARAELELRRSDHAQALVLASRAAVLTESDYALVRCDALRVLGDAQLAVNRHADAVATFDQLIAMADPFPCRRAEGHEGAAAAAAALEQLEAARKHLATANEIRHHTGSQRVRRPAVEHHLARLETGPHPAATRADGIE